MQMFLFQPHQILPSHVTLTELKYKNISTINNLPPPPAFPTSPLRLELVVPSGDGGVSQTMFSSTDTSLPLPSFPNPPKCRRTLPTSSKAEALSWKNILLQQSHQLPLSLLANNHFWAICVYILCWYLRF